MGRRCTVAVLQPSVRMSCRHLLCTLPHVLQVHDGNFALVTHVLASEIHKPRAAKTFFIPMVHSPLGAM
jgi:hypothetical protein